MTDHKQYLTAPILHVYPYTDRPNLTSKWTPIFLQRFFYSHKQVECGGQFIYDHGTCRYVNQTALINDETNTSN